MVVMPHHLTKRFFQVVIATIMFCGASIARAAPEVVTVKRGDYLLKIARSYGVNLKELMSWNRLSSTVIHPGQKLRLRPPPQSVVFEARKLLGINVKVISVNLADPNVFISPILPSLGLGHGVSLDRLTAGSSAIAVLNGGFFHPRSFVPAGDLVVGGRYLFQGRLNTALTITHDGHPSIHTITASTSGVSVSRTRWQGFETVIANGPYILRSGQIVVNPKAEGYRDPAVWQPAARTAIGVRGRKLVFMVTRDKITLTRLGQLMRALGAQDAINLDGGSSVGLAWQRRVLIRPQRPLAYGIGIYTHRPD